MKVNLFVFLFQLGLMIPCAFSQGNSRYWCFGDSAGIDFSNVSIPTPILSYMDTPYSCASLGDSNGLLMYTHTKYWPYVILGSQRTTVVRNKYHNVIENGDSLIGNSFYNGLVLINKPGIDSIFYLFQWGFAADLGLYYSVIEPYFNNDSGIVVSKNIKLQLTDSSLEFGVNAIRHGNGRDWWIITRNGNNSNRFNLFYVGPDTIVGPLEQNIGTMTTTNSTQLSFSKEGDKIALVSSYPNLVEVYDFDRCSGAISNPLSILISGSTFRMGGSEFSANGQVLYVANADNIFGDSLRLFQINLASPNPQNSIEVIYKEKVPASGGNLRRGPDDKIYLSCLYEVGWPYPDTCRNQYNENLSVINYPDSIGLACDFSPFSFYLGGKRTYWSLPNNADFNLGALDGSSCDTLALSIENVIKDSYEMYPNPANSKVSFIFNNDIEREILIYDVYCRNVISTSTLNRYFSLDISSLISGTYYIQVSGGMTSKLLILK